MPKGFVQVNPKMKEVATPTLQAENFFAGTGGHAAQAGMQALCRYI